MRVRDTYRLTLLLYSKIRKLNGGVYAFSHTPLGFQSRRSSRCPHSLLSLHRFNCDNSLEIIEDHGCDNDSLRTVTMTKHLTMWLWFGSGCIPELHQGESHGSQYQNCC